MAPYAEMYSLRADDGSATTHRSYSRWIQCAIAAAAVAAGVFWLMQF
jgi:hypothetical protein